MLPYTIYAEENLGKLTDFIKGKNVRGITLLRTSVTQIRGPKSYFALS